MGVCRLQGFVAGEFISQRKYLHLCFLRPTMLCKEVKMRTLLSGSGGRTDERVSGAGGVGGGGAAVFRGRVRPK